MNPIVETGASTTNDTASAYAFDPIDADKISVFILLDTNKNGVVVSNKESL